MFSTFLVFANFYWQPKIRAIEKQVELFHSPNSISLFWVSNCLSSRQTVRMTLRERLLAAWHVETGDAWTLSLDSPLLKSEHHHLNCQCFWGVLLSVSPWRRQQHISSSQKPKEKLWLPQVGHVERGVQFIALFWTPFCEPVKLELKSIIQVCSLLSTAEETVTILSGPDGFWSDGTLWVTKMKSVCYPPTKWVRRFRFFTLQTENCNFGAHFTCPFPISTLVTNYVLLSIILARSIQAHPSTWAQWRWFGRPHMGTSGSVFVCALWHVFYFNSAVSCHLLNLVCVWAFPPFSPHP